MAFFFLSLFTFIMFFQPGIVFPGLAEYNPYRYSAIVAIATFLITSGKYKGKILSFGNARYFMLFVAAQVLSSSSIWLRGGADIVLNTWLNLVIIYFLIVKICTDERKIKLILMMIILGIVYLSLYSLYNYHMNHGNIGNLASGYGIYENRNDLVLILVAVIPMLFIFAELSNRKIFRMTFLVIIVLFSLNVILAGSRNGLLGLAVVGFLSIVFIKKFPRIFRILMIVLLTVSIVGVGISTVLTRSDLEGNLTGDGSSEDRIIQWKACLRMVKDNPFLGVGPKESPYEMVNYGGIRGLAPHNTLVQVFAETGIPGGIFFMLCTILPLFQGYKYFKENNYIIFNASVVIYKYLIISLAGFWACAIFSNRVYFNILYVLIALITAIRENILKKEELLAPSLT